MGIKKMRYSHRYIHTLKVLLLVVAFGIPLTFMGIANSLNISFDESMTTLVLVMTCVIVFVIYYEGKNVVSSMENYYLEVTPHHILRVRDQLKDMYLYADLDEVVVKKNAYKQVQSIHLQVNGRRVSLQHYTDMESIYEVIKKRVAVKYKTHKHPMAAAFGLIASFSLIALIIVTTQLY